MGREPVLLPAARVPIKDAAILSNCPEGEVRRVWLPPDPRPRWTDRGGAASSRGCGSARPWGWHARGARPERDVLPGVRFACDAYVNFARQQPWARPSPRRSPSSSARPIRVRLAALDLHYPWIDPAGLEYFRARLHQAPRDAQYALDLVAGALAHARAAAGGGRRAGPFKCDLLWAQLEAIDRGDTRPPEARLVVAEPGGVT